MTENEAMSVLHYLLGCENAVDAGEIDEHNCLNSQEKEALKFILEEIQQYRAIGTVEDLKSMKENGAFTGVELAQLSAMQMRLKEYSAIGTIDEFKGLKEKSVAKKPLHQGWIYVCPCCNDKATIGSVFLRPNQKYCIDCGTEFDWQ